MNHHRGARSATTLACVGLACFADHFSDRINSPLGTVLLILFNIVLFTVAIWHFKKAWWLTAILILSMITVPFKTKADPQPKVILCWIIGGAVVIGGSYAAYKIYKCAKRNLYPPAPPTNAPPPQAWPDQGLGAHTASFDSWTNYPMVDLEIDESAAGSNWVDWQGYPIAYCFAGMITNLSMNGSNYCYQESVDLRSWIPMVLSITGWVSQVNGLDYNQISVTYRNGQAFSTNWHHIDSTGTNAVLIGTVGRGFPVEKSGSRFFKLAAVGPSAQ